MTHFTALDGLAQHLGQWQGRFLQLDPISLHPISQRQSLISFERRSEGSIRQTNIYYGPEERIDAAQPGQSWVYTDLSPGIRFFPDGSFSNGRLQLAPFSEFGAEQGFLWGDRKARVVTLFNRQGQLSGLTVILEVRREWQPQDQAWISACLDPHWLHRPWQGQQLRYTTTDLSPSQNSIRISPDHVQDPRFLIGNLWMSGARQVPDPLQQRERSFRLELGWMPEPGVYLQLIREYDPQGAWSQISWIQATGI